MAQFTSLYDVSRDALISYEFIEDSSIAGLMRISNLANANSGSFTVKDSFIEDNTLTVYMRLSKDGVLRIKGEYIEEDRTSITPPPPPIPPPVGNITYDDFKSYTSLISLNGLNSGSNEWDNTTPLAAYFAREAFVGIKEFDNFNDYAADTSLSSSLTGLGSGSWRNTYNYYGREAFVGIKEFDNFNDYAADTSLSSSLTGLGSGSWRNTYNYYGREAFVGIKATEYMEGYSVNDNVNGLNLGSGSLGGIWGWDGAWVSRTDKFLYGIKVYDDFSTYSVSSNLNGQNGYPYEKWNNTWNGAWVVKLNVNGNI